MLKNRAVFIKKCHRSPRRRWFLGLHYNGKMAGNMTGLVLSGEPVGSYLWKKENGYDSRDGCDCDGGDGEQDGR